MDDTSAITSDEGSDLKLNSDFQHSREQYGLDRRKCEKSHCEVRRDNLLNDDPLNEIAIPSHQITPFS
jgi:hypothetical protein